MLIIRLLDRKTFRQLQEFHCAIDRLPWEDIRVWQTFAHVTLHVIPDS